MNSPTTGSGVISRLELYTIRQLKQRLGISDSSIRELRKMGLPVIRIGRTAYISGRQVILFLEGRANNAHQS